MSQQENQPSSVEDLTITEDQATDVKGGAVVDYFLHVDGIDGEATSMGGPVHGGWDYQLNKKI